MKLALCCPTITRPHDATLSAIAGSVPLLDALGIEHAMVSEVGNPYISNARNTMLRKALDWRADQVVFIDHDVSWAPVDLVKLIQANGDCVAGLYRFKTDAEERYMGTIYSQDDGRPRCRPDGCIDAELVPAGFLRVSRSGINSFIRAYPDLCYGEPCAPHVDLFNHGAYQGLWYGEDYAFSRRWREGVGPIAVIPDLDLTHWRDDRAYPGNYHRFLMRQPGGSDAKQVE